MDTFNKFMVSMQGESIVIVRPLPPRLTKDEALQLAAWLVALTDPAQGQFKELLEAVCNS